MPLPDVLVGTLMASSAARILERLALFGNELPVIALAAQGQFQHSEGIGVPNLAIGFWRAK